MEAERRNQLKAVSQMALAVFAAESRDGLSDAILGKLPEVVAHDKSMLTWNMPEFLTDGGRRVCSRTLSAKDIARYEDRFFRHDYTAWYLNMPEVRVYRDSDLVSAEHMQQSLIFNEWVQPMGMYHVCGAVFRVRGKMVGDIVLFRAETEGDFSDDELFLLDLVTSQVETRVALFPLRSADAVGDWRNILTEREREVALLAATDRGVRDIADDLGISYGTVRKHLAAVYDKLGISSRVQLVRLLTQSTQNR